MGQKMERKNYLITSDHGHRIIKHAFNSSVREIEKMMREVAYSDNCSFCLTEKTLVKDNAGNAVSGVRTWQGDNGKKVFFKIVLQ